VGVRVELKILPYARAKEMVRAGELAGCFAMSPAPDLEGKVVLSREPLYASVSTFVRRKGDHEQVTSLDRVPRTATVGIVNDYEYPEAIRRLEQRGVRLSPNRSEVASLEMLAEGRLTFAVLQLDGLKSLAGLLVQTKAQGRVEPAFRLTPQGSYVGFSLAHPQGPWAKKNFDQGLARIKANGTQRKILKDWLRRGLPCAR
jgi:ABC-type amino acid transport substrate-binding protein